VFSEIRRFMFFNPLLPGKVFLILKNPGFGQGGAVKTLFKYGRLELDAGFPKLMPFGLAAS
jgi:hypothetical protein